MPQWIPKSEFGLAFGLIQASGNLGAVITMPICGFLSVYGFAGGWPSVFYIFGSIAVLFLAPWLYFISNSPEEHSRISVHERVYIKMNLAISHDANGNGKRKSLVPWCAILTSPKIWAIAVTRFCSAWGNLFLMSQLPTYLKSILHLPITYVSNYCVVIVRLWLYSFIVIVSFLKPPPLVASDSDKSIKF